MSEQKRMWLTVAIVAIAWYWWRTKEDGKQ